MTETIIKVVNGFLFGTGMILAATVFKLVGWGFCG